MLKFKTRQNDNIIPIFFATDDNYAPYLGVTLRSLIDNASKDYFYKIHILITSINENNERILKGFESENVSIEFFNVTEKLDKIGSKLFLRDYYSKATYYRFFIPALFPEYKKALYLDCDIIVVDDISKLYNKDLGNNYVGAIYEEVMATVNVFGNYVEQALGIETLKYFNAGILLMNLEQFRKQDVEGQFVKLLSRFKFAVTQDQDYLNVICKDKVAHFDLGWNKTPIESDFKEEDLKIIHYKIAWKPWHYDNVLYGDYFWKYAKETEYYDIILNEKNNYSDIQKQKDADAYDRLVNLAIKDTNDENNYKRTIDREKQKSSFVLGSPTYRYVKEFV